MTGQPLVHPKSFKRLQDKPRTVFYRARGGSLFRTIRVLNAILRGWRQYFKLFCLCARQRTCVYAVKVRCPPEPGKDE